MFRTFENTAGKDLRVIISNKSPYLMTFNPRCAKTMNVWIVVAVVFSNSAYNYLLYLCFN